MNVALKAYEKVRHAVRYFLLRRLPTCKAVTPLISESLERRLGIRERMVLALHLFVCVWCVWYLDQLRAVRAACLGRGTREDAPSDIALSQEARDRIRQALRAGSK